LIIFPGFAGTPGVRIADEADQSGIFSIGMELTGSVYDTMKNPQEAYYSHHTIPPL
jgi:hypothetical protein